MEPLVLRGNGWHELLVRLQALAFYPKIQLIESYMFLRIRELTVHKGTTVSSFDDRHIISHLYCLASAVRFGPTYRDGRSHRGGSLHHSELTLFSEPGITRVLCPPSKNFWTRTRRSQTADKSLQN